MKGRIVVIFLFLFIITQFYPLESVLIDFNNLDKTTINFAEMAKGVFIPEELKGEMIVDLNPRKWFIRVNSSSWTKDSREKTYVFPIRNSQNFPNQTVLGVRIYFPERYANSYATLVPPFDIPSYYDNPENPTGMGDMFINKGVVRNVGILRKLSVQVLGNNFKYSLYIRIENEDGEQRDIFVGFLDYVGWRTKSWVNPNIDQEILMRQLQTNSKPIYPDQYPYIKLKGFVIHRTELQITGNFVTMIKDVTIEYDEAIIETGKTEDRQEEILEYIKKS